jgi:hypothetical protein
MSVNRVNGAALRAELEAKGEALPALGDEVAYAIGARERVDGEGVVAITASDVFD